MDLKRFPYIAILAAVIAVSYIAGYWSSHRDTGKNHAQSPRIPLYYQCPMHPSYRSDKPGDAPCCGMKLVPVYEDAKFTDTDSREAVPAGSIRISPEKQQFIGVRTAVAQITPGSQSYRLLGTVSADETRVYKIKAAVDGVIKEVHPGTVGSYVKKDQALASYYSPDIYQAEQGFLIALSSDRYRNNLQVQVTASRLRFLGMSAQQIEDLKQTQQLTESITLCSPVSGFILSREVYPDLVFQKGEELYRIADLSRMWIFADVFENEARHLRPGFKAKIFQPQSQLQFTAQVSNVLPQFDGTTRTLKVRMEADNSDFTLRPGMFVDVEFTANVPGALTIPAEAVIDSGRRKMVYVESANGVFEPRQVETGWRLGDRVQIVRGLERGERIVVSGNFLIDSESRMKLADSAASMPERKKVKDPVCGMEIAPDSPNTVKVERDGRTYYFCSTVCKSDFLANPGKYISKKPAEAPKIVKDLVCGMDVDPKSAGTLKAIYKGNTYYFCSEICKRNFEADPAKYIQKGRAARDMYGKEMAK
jgi:membrane fusion protein, copper/silver efflux system